MLAPYCDGIDLNCGCPQGIAKRGNYGAFLLEQPDALLAVVHTLVQNQLSVPLSVKVRLLPGATREESIQNSLSLYRQLVNAGIAMLTVHGRTRHHKGHLTGPADWEAIRQVVQELSHEIPIVANGGIGSLEDALSCWRETGVDAVMSSEAILEHPALFLSNNKNNNNTQKMVGRVQLAREYLQLAKSHPSDEGGQGSGLKCARMHLHRMLHADLQQLEDLRQQLSDAASLQELELVLEQLEAIHQEQQHEVDKEELSWYIRHRQIVSVNGLMVNISDKKRDNESKVKNRMDLDDDAAECFACLFDDGEY
jgi:tRNA-dihydrouridine synthase 1